MKHLYIVFLLSSVLTLIEGCTPVISSRCSSAVGDGYCVDRQYCVPTLLNSYTVTNTSCGRSNQVCCVVPTNERPTEGEPCQPFGQQAGECINWLSTECNSSARKFRDVCEGGPNVQCCAAPFDKCPTVCQINPCIPGCSSSSNTSLCPTPVPTPSSAVPTPSVGPNCSDPSSCQITCSLQRVFFVTTDQCVLDNHTESCTCLPYCLLQNTSINCTTALECPRDNIPDCNEACTALGQSCPYDLDSICSFNTSEPEGCSSMEGCCQCGCPTINCTDPTICDITCSLQNITFIDPSQCLFDPSIDNCSCTELQCVNYSNINPNGTAECLPTSCPPSITGNETVDCQSYCGSLTEDGCAEDWECAALTEGYTCTEDYTCCSCTCPSGPVECNTTSLCQTVCLSMGLTFDNADQCQYNGTTGLCSCSEYNCEGNPGTTCRLISDCTSMGGNFTSLCGVVGEVCCTV